MAKQPEDLVLRILRNIHQTQADHTRTFAEFRERFDQIERRFDENNEGLITALGL